MALAQRIRQADDKALTATLKAEATFAQAERRLIVELSRRGAQEAIESYDLRYKAIAEADAEAAKMLDQASAAGS